MLRAPVMCCGPRVSAINVIPRVLIFRSVNFQAFTSSGMTRQLFYSHYSDTWKPTRSMLTRSRGLEAPQGRARSLNWAEP